MNKLFKEQIKITRTTEIVKHKKIKVHSSRLKR